MGRKEEMGRKIGDPREESLKKGLAQPAESIPEV
jgi:hypothetical protein